MYCRMRFSRLIEAIASQLFRGEVSTNARSTYSREKRHVICASKLYINAFARLGSDERRFRAYRANPTLRWTKARELLLLSRGEIRFSPPLEELGDPTRRGSSPQSPVPRDHADSVRRARIGPLDRALRENVYCYCIVRLLPPRRRGDIFIDITLCAPSPAVRRDGR